MTQGSTLELTPEAMAGLQQVLAQNFGAELAGSIVSTMETYRAENSGPNYMEVKTLSVLVEQTRVQALCAIRSYKAWAKIAAADKFDHPIYLRQGQMLKRHAVEQVQFYKDSKLAFHAAYQVAMARIRRSSRAPRFDAQDDMDMATYFSAAQG